MKLTKEQLVDAISQTKQYHDEHESGGATELSALRDVLCKSPTEGQTLRFSEEDQKWHNGEADVGVELTKAEYDALPESKYSDNVTYFIKDAGGSGGGSTGAGEMELTQAEYDALPDSKNTDGINYFITDGEVPGIIGEAGLAFDLLWKNSNPNSTFAAQTIELDLSDYGAAYIVYKLINSTGDGSYSTILALIDDTMPATSVATCYYDTSWILLRPMVVRPTGISVYDGKKNGSINNDVIIPSLIYGIKKASVAPAKSTVDYSTEEQVVGTWIDGKPLYRKYLKLENLVGSGVFTFTFDDLGIQNIRDVIKYDAYEKRTSGTLVKLHYYASTVNPPDLSFLLIRSSDIYYYRVSSAIEYITVFIEYTKTTD